MRLSCAGYQMNNAVKRNRLLRHIIEHIDRAGISLKIAFIGSDLFYGRLHRYYFFRWNFTRSNIATNQARIICGQIFFKDHGIRFRCIIQVPKKSVSPVFIGFFIRPAGGKTQIFNAPIGYRRCEFDGDQKTFNTLALRHG